MKSFQKNLSDFSDLDFKTQSKIYDKLALDIAKNQIIQVIAYCLMPTHIHLVLKQISDNGITSFVNKLLNSYSRYFNLLHGRKGPLWESRFKSIHIDSDELLLHITRYNHLNPSSGGLVKKPEDWKYSSYNEYLNKTNIKICEFNDLLNIDSKTYRKFVNDRISYQKEISKIKALILEDYFG